MKKLLLILLAFVSMMADAANISIGYKREDTNVWCYTGFGNQSGSDIKMGAAIKITPEMYKDYIGAKISSLKVSWCDMDHSSACSVFMRKNLTDTENILSGSGTLKWSAASGNSYQGKATTISFSNPDGLTLTEDLGTFYVGYYADKVVAGSIAIGTSYPANQAGSAYIWGDVEGENYDADGNELWSDQSSAGTLFVDLVVTGTFTNKVSIDNFINYPTMLSSKASDGLMTITNKGTNSVSRIVLDYACGENTKSETVSLSSSIATGESKTITVPAWALGHGDHTVTISKVGSTANNLAEPYHYEAVMIPDEVAAKYTRTSLVEFFESENSYYVPRYYDELFMPGYETYADHLNLVAQHMNDQWMTGDDDETLLQLQLCDNDSSAVCYPAISIDRSPNITLMAMGISKKGTFHDVIYPEGAPYLYEPAIARPTYASINVESAVDGDKAHVTVTGDIADGVIGDEPLYVTAYLLEDDVYTDSQEQSELGAGEYYHDNLQRLRLTELWGNPVAVRSGEYSMTFDADLYPDEWNLDNMRVVAFINRGLEGNNKWNRDILNSASCSLKSTDGIREIKTDGESHQCYDLQGRRVSAPSHGIYILNGKKLMK